VQIVKWLALVSLKEFRQVQARWGKLHTRKKGQAWVGKKHFFHPLQGNGEKNRRQRPLGAEQWVL